ncbi:hypothetical protein ACTXT7_016219, partial [Hymenolepis weldensis]
MEIFLRTQRQIQCSVPDIKANAPNQEEGKGQVLRKRKETMVIKLKPVLENFWTSAHPGLAGKSPTEILIIRRSRPRLHQSPEYVLEKGISRQEGIPNQRKHFKPAQSRNSTKRRRPKME